MQKALNTLLVASKCKNAGTATGRPTKSESSTTSAESFAGAVHRPISAQVKTFVKGIDNQKQPSIVDREKPELPDTRQLQRQPGNPLSAGDQDYRLETQWLSLSHYATSGEVPPATTVHLEHGSDNCQPGPGKDAGREPESGQQKSVSGSSKGNQFWDEMAAYCATYESTLSSTVVPVTIPRKNQTAFSSREVNSEIRRNSQIHVNSGQQPPPTADYVGAALSHFREESSRNRNHLEESSMSIVSRERQLQSSGLDSTKYGFVQGAPQHTGASDMIGSSSSERFQRVTPAAAITAGDEPIGRSRQPGEMTSLNVADPIEANKDVRYVNLSMQNMLVTVGNDRFRYGDTDRRMGHVDGATTDGPRLSATTRYDTESARPSDFSARAIDDDEFTTVGDRGRGSAFSDDYYGSQRRPFFDANSRPSTMRTSAAGGGDHIEYIDQRIVVTRDFGRSSSAAAATNNESQGVEWRTLLPKHR